MSYEKNYEDYMKAFGIPSFIVSLVLGLSEVLTITELSEQSENGNTVYSFKTVMGRCCQKGSKVQKLMFAVCC